MVEWRDRGFVQDSDDDEDLSIVTQSSHRESDESQANGAARASPINAPCASQTLKDLKVTAESLHGSVSGQKSPEIAREQAECARDEEDVDELQLDHFALSPLDHSNRRSTENTNKPQPTLDIDDGFTVLSSPEPSPPHSLKACSEPTDTGDMRSITKERNGTPVTRERRSRIEVQVVIPSPRAPQNTTSPAIEQSAFQGWKKRSLRERKAIQLHPFRLEDQKYRNIMLAGGVKPVRVTSQSQRRKDSVGEADEEEIVSQDRASSPAAELSQEPISSDAGMGENRDPNSSLSLVPSSPPRLATTGSDDELPELSELFRKRTKPGKLLFGHKRRKVQHLPSSSHSSAPKSPSAVHAKTNTLPTSSHSARNIFDAPPSPPGSAVPSPALPQHIAQSGFRYPIGFSPERLPTPATSSSANIQFEHRPKILLSEDSPAPALSRITSEIIQSPVTNHTPIELSDSLPSSEDSDGSGKIREAKKRIKGVLPASWLKLDLQAQVKKPKPRTTSPKRPAFREHETDHQRGVAQRRIRTASRPQSPPSPALVVFDDDSEEAPDLWESPRPASASNDMDPFVPSLNASIQPSNIRVDEDPDELMEDNGIDHMLPSAERNYHKFKLGRKRQVKLKDAFTNPQKRLKATTPSRSIGVPTKASARTHRREIHSVASRRKAPKLSIIDVLSDDINHLVPTPAFLKVAARQARRHPNQGRQGPVNKHIRLQTRQDTAEANSVLQEWRSGAIPQRTSNTRLVNKVRSPLAEREGNEQLAHKLFINDLPAEANSNKPLHKRSRLYQTQLQTVIIRRPRSGKSLEQERLLGKPRAPSRKSTKRWKPWHSAQLEVDETEMGIQEDRLRFQQALRKADQEFEVRHVQPSMSDQSLDASINQGLRHSISGRRGPPTGFTLNKVLQPLSDDKGLSNNASKQPSPYRRQLRKRQGRRIDVEAREYRQPEEFMLPTLRTIASVESADLEQPILQDLSPYGVQYAKDFDVLPLAVGTYFHSSTFVGSGEFRRSLMMDHRNLDEEAGKHTISIEGCSCTWTQWNEEMAVDVERIFTNALNLLKPFESVERVSTTAGQNQEVLSRIATILRKILKANSDWLTFSDPIDRSAYVTKFCDCLDPLQMSTVEALDVFTSKNASGEIIGMLVRVAALQIALVQQMLVIGEGHPIPTDTTTRPHDMLRTLCGAVVRYLNRKGFEDIREFYEENQRHSIREAGIRDDKPAIEALLLVAHVLKVRQIPKFSLWDAINSELLVASSNANRVGMLESKWYNMFTVLPILEMDSSGLLQVGHRFEENYDNWDAVKCLTSRVFTLYPATSNTPGSTINEYVRSLLIRIHHLIQGWGWWKCESIIGVIFDFFARNNLAPLRKEDVRGSPRFLEVLAREPSLSVNAEDKSFHIFLKIVAIGLRGMQNVYSDKIIRGIAWRYIPNHGRTYKKDQELKQEDLDALRNHHDLLCTLYWASPSGFRPRVDLIQNLVDHTASHREACRVNIKAWTNLVAYQLSTNEAPELLEPFACWFKEIVEQTIDQYKLARSEAETQYTTAQKDGNTSISADLLRAIIARNQNQVLASLVEAIAGMKAAVNEAKSRVATSELIQNSKVERVFTLFDANKTRTNSAIVEVLSIYKAYFALPEERNSQETTQQTSEESQDYGDWPEDSGEGLVGSQVMSNSPTLDFVFEPVSQLLSNCFGAESPPDDSLLNAVVDTWTQLAFSAVRNKHKEWASFIDEYSSHSWSQLRNTEQTRKYGPYFLSSILECDAETFGSNRLLFISAWMAALVERDSQLKFQHRLTACMLKSNPDDPLFTNPPFTRSGRSEIFDISTTEFRERRLALLSNILSNMRDHLDEALKLHPSTVPELRREYSYYLKLLMGAMKKNYIDLHQGDTAVGTYVNFVQKVVEFLQQYTSDIYTVDKFFTDSSMFPLPATDPTYVVGRLKGYSAKLEDPKVMKQLAVFFLNVSERAAVDNEQPYLVEQLHTAMSNAFEPGSADRPTLRSVLVQAIFPAYIEASFTTLTGWVMARPILQACSGMFNNFLFQFCATDDLSVTAAVTLLVSFLSTLKRAVSDLEDRTEMFVQPHALCMLSWIFRTVTAIIPSLDYILRRTGRGKITIHTVTYFIDFSIFAAKTVLEYDDPFVPLDHNDEPRSELEYSDIRQFCARELQQDLAKRWKRDGEQYFLLRGSMRKEVVVDVGTIDEERDILVGAIEELHTVLEGMEMLGRF